MEGVSHPLFRDMMVERGGLDLVCTEFVRITAQPVSAARLRREVRKTPGCPLSVQVMGNDVQQMADAAAIVGQAGADVVDINLGCPMPRVVRKGVGAAMLQQPELLYAVLTRMRNATSGLLSAKIRAGFDDADSAVAIAQLVEDAGADFITVHPRRRRDFYAGVADWRIIRDIKRALTIPVVGNGDVWYAADAARMQRETGCDAVMIGRPALRNPWIFQQIAAEAGGRSALLPDGNLVIHHLEEVSRRYAPEMTTRKLGALGPFKELVRWIARAVPDEGAFAKEALRGASVDDILNSAQRHLGRLGPEDLDLCPTGHLQLEHSGAAD